MTQSSGDQLAERHRAEAKFHDHKYATRESFPRHYRIHPTYPVFVKMLQLGGELSGKDIVEYGCGDGWTTVELARRGARVSAFDISGEAVAQTQVALKKANVDEHCRIEVMGGETLRYPDNSFDLAFGFAILHHLEMESALRELRRILRPGGRAIFGEPLASNPIINLYRRLTPQFRTEDEAPIDLKALSSQLSGFSSWEHHEQLLFASGASALCYVPGLSGLAAPAQRVLGKIDDVVLRVAPWAGKWAWYSVLVFQK